MKIFITLLLLVITVPAQAERLFNVEVLIFKHNTTTIEIQENLNFAHNDIDFKHVGNFYDQNYLMQKKASLLKSSQYALNEQANILQQDPNFTLLTHIAWQQSDQSQKNAPIFFIHGKYDFSEHFTNDGLLKNLSALYHTDELTDHNIAISKLNDRMLDTSEQQNDLTLFKKYAASLKPGSIINQSTTKQLYELQGKLQVYVQHYLYALVELDLRIPEARCTIPEALTTSNNDITNNFTDANMPNFQSVAEDLDTTQHKIQKHCEIFLKSYRLNEKRLMRTKEIHYLDHPLMGVIISVTRAN